jgi:endonuclease YncB( thermonuclease family)
VLFSPDLTRASALACICAPFYWRRFWLKSWLCFADSNSMSGLANRIALAFAALFVFMVLTGTSAATVVEFARDGVRSAVASVRPDQGPRSYGEAFVERTVGGDRLVLADGRVLDLAQIDGPDAGRCGYQLAQRTLARLVPPGAVVEIQEDPAIDRHAGENHLVAYAVVGGKAGRAVNLSMALVMAGVAAPAWEHSIRGLYADELERAAARAKAAGKGVWGACPGSAVTLHGFATPPAR